MSDTDAYLHVIGRDLAWEAFDGEAGVGLRRIQDVVASAAESHGVPYVDAVNAVADAVAEQMRRELLWASRIDRRMTETSA
jgi:hypothetical protein